MLNSTASPSAGAAKEKPSDIDCMDALNNCKRALAMLYCISSAAYVDAGDKDDARDFATYHLADQLQTLRAYFEMDKKEAAS